MTITEELKVSEELIAFSGFADVRTGTYMGHRVAVKILNVSLEDDLLEIRKVSVNDIVSAARNGVLTIFPQRFCKEVILWNRLSHPNILKFVGVHGDMDKGEFTAVSELTAHGNIMEYIRKNRVNRLELVRGFTVPATSFTKVSQ